MKPRRSALGLLLVGALLLSACGRYGPPRRIPAVPDEPAAIAEETNAQEATQNKDDSE